MNELVSVVIPTYNRAKLIVRSVQSVLNQTYSNIEILVVDDCSTDSTKSAVTSIGDQRVKYFKLDKNSGACVARNYGIDKAQGSLIAFQDSDDVWDSKKLELQVHFLNESQADACFCDVRRIALDSQIPKIFPADMHPGLISRDDILEKSIVSTQCLLIKRQCLGDVRFDPEMPRLQDWDFVLRLTESCILVHLNKPLVTMHVQSDSISAHPERGIIAIRKLFDKYESEFSNYPTARRNLYLALADYELDNHSDATFAFRQAYSIDHSFNVGVKLLLAQVHLLQLVVQISRKFKGR